MSTDHTTKNTTAHCKYRYILQPIILLPTGIILLLDQLTKYIIIKSNPELDLQLIKIHLIYNTGAGFGILQNNSFILGLFSLIITIVIVYNFPKIATTKYTQILWGIFLGGVTGNMLDRLIRTKVIDFIDLGWFPAFNIADAALTISTLLLIIYYLKNEK